MGIVSDEHESEVFSLAEIIGMRIRARREELNITQMEAARRCGITQSKLSEYEAWEPGNPKPSLSTIEKLCEGLKISAAELLK